MSIETKAGDGQGELRDDLAVPHGHESAAHVRQGLANHEEPYPSAVVLTPDGEKGLENLAEDITFHAAAVVGHPDQTGAVALHVDVNSVGSSIKGVFQQLLDR